MRKPFKLGSLALAGLASLSFGSGAKAQLHGESIKNSEGSETPIVNIIKARKFDPFKAHSSHSSHRSHRSHRSGSGGSRPGPAPTPPSGDSTGPTTVLPPTYARPNAADFDITVRRVQAVLFAQGYYTGDIDGLMGPMTSTAISRYQARNGLQVTGTVNNELLEAMGIATQ